MNIYVEAVKDWTDLERFTLAQHHSWQSVWSSPVFMLHVTHSLSYYCYFLQKLIIWKINHLLNLDSFVQFIIVRMLFLHWQTVRVLTTGQQEQIFPFRQILLPGPWTSAHIISKIFGKWIDKKVISLFVGWIASLSLFIKHPIESPLNIFVISSGLS